MGSPLGSTFASYYMCHLENKAFRELHVKLSLYCGYVDDCFVSINNITYLHALRDYFQQHSILKFTFEREIGKKLPFLDILLHRESGKIMTSTYTKPATTGECLNYNSLCPEKYSHQHIFALIVPN